MTQSAAQLAKAADELFGAYNPPRLVLVGHSMGGLVAREWTAAAGGFGFF